MFFLSAEVGERLRMLLAWWASDLFLLATFICRGESTISIAGRRSADFLQYCRLHKVKWLMTHCPAINQVSLCAVRPQKASLAKWHFLHSGRRLRSAAPNEKDSAVVRSHLTVDISRVAKQVWRLSVSDLCVFYNSDAATVLRSGLNFQLFWQLVPRNNSLF